MNKRTGMEALRIDYLGILVAPRSSSAFTTRILSPHTSVVTTAGYKFMARSKQG